MAFILSKYEVYIHSHKPFWFLYHLLLSSVSQLFLVYSAMITTIERNILLGAHGNLVHIIFLGAYRFTELLLSYS